ncbi:MAG: AAA family ATPase [Acidimicrobiales bacterium]
MKNDPQDGTDGPAQHTSAAQGPAAPPSGRSHEHLSPGAERPGALAVRPAGGGDQPPAPQTLEAEVRREQAAVDRAYERLGSMREAALDVVRHHRELGETTTGQARVEWESLLALTDQRLHHLELGGASLCFGRLDLEDGDTYQVGRLSVLDEQGDPLVIDWRAPAAEPFYRATGRNAMGLVRRRHLLTRGRTVIGLDDEVFDLDRAADGSLSVVGEGALMAALERSRTGRMGDIVATIQAEQDEIIRAPIPGILIVQGGPGTGKTAVALHRAAYLLYTNRQRLEDAGVLVVGPNRTFLRYIEQVLPSLGESGVELVTIDGLANRVRTVASEPAATERLKGDARMVRVIRKAVADRQRPLPDDLVVPYGARNLRVPRAELARIVAQVSSRQGTHNERRAAFARRLRRVLWRQQRRIVEQRLTRLPAELPLDPTDELDPLDVIQSAALTIEREEQNFLSGIGHVPEVRAALERMWPVLTPEELLNDLFGAPGLLRLATEGVLSGEERALLARPRSKVAEAAPWTSADLALLDEAAGLLGPIPSARRKRLAQVRDDARWMIEDTVGDISLQTGELDATMRRQLINRLTERELAAQAEDDDDGAPPVYGHVIVDEAQDLSPMQWRMIARRCTIGSMTVVGDLGQASRPGAIASWNEALAQLPVRREPRRAMLTVNYRTPAEIMEVAARVLAVTDPDADPPRSVRHSGAVPRFARCGADEVVDEAVAHVARVRSELAEGKTAVIAPEALVGDIRGRLGGLPSAADVLDAAVGVFSATEAKGLEFDAVVLVEPAAIAGSTVAGLRGLYVALTRATRFLTVLHSEELPPGLRIEP